MRPCFSTMSHALPLPTRLSVILSVLLFNVHFTLLQDILCNVWSFDSFVKSVNKFTKTFIGLTESCGGCFNSIANAYSMIGTVGIPNTSIEARLESVPEMEYDALSSTPRGELCLRGNTLFSGYHKRQDLTQEVVVDGWFHTGKYHLCKLSILICVVLWMLLWFEAIINKIL